MIIFGGFFSIVYLYVFNRITRQSLHDLAVGTYVVNFSAKYEEVGNIWIPHLAIVALLFITSILVPIGVSNVAKTEPFKGLLETQEELNGHNNIMNSGITEGSSSFTSSESGSKTTTFVNAYGVLYKNEIDNENLAMELARIIIGSYPESLNKDVIQVTLTYGYDIGITSMWNKHNYTFSPDEFNVSE
jgi:hypothetical protein